MDSFILQLTPTKSPAFLVQMAWNPNNGMIRSAIEDRIHPPAKEGNDKIKTPFVYL
jgi:hypothetical protein